MRSTRTFAELQVSDSAWHEIAELLRLAGYDHAFIDGRVIDMHGIGLTARAPGEIVVHYQGCPAVEWEPPACTCGLRLLGDDSPAMVEGSDE